jgi:hypothetical protein
MKWRTAVLKEYFERVLAERDLRYMQMAADTKEALGKAESALREYKAAANEFRGTLSDQAQTFMPRAEAELQIRQIESRIEESRRQAVANSQWRAGQWVAVLIGALGGVVALVLHFTR